MDWHFQAVIFIVKQTFWMKGKPIEESLIDALEQFKKQGHVEKLKNCISPASLPSNPDDLLIFLYEWIIHLWGRCFNLQNLYHDRLSTIIG